MKVCEKAELVIKPKYAFGAKGNPELNVPPEATVYYTVCLLKLGTKRSQEDKDKEAFEECKKVKDSATEKFKAKEFKEASDLYLDGVSRVSELSYLTPENKKFK